MAEDKHSISARGRKLREGESVSRTVRIPVEEAADRVAEETSKLRNSMNQIAVRLRENKLRDYRVESTQGLTADASAVLVTVAITCLDDEGQDDII